MRCSISRDSVVIEAGACCAPGYTLAIPIDTEENPVVGTVVKLRNGGAGGGGVCGGYLVVNMKRERRPAAYRDLVKRRVG